MAFGLVFILRIVQLLFAIIVLGLSGYVAGQFNDRFFGLSDSPSSVNFNVFLSVWTILVVIFLLLATRFDSGGRHIGHRFVVFGLDALTALFWFAGFIALAAWVGIPHFHNSIVGSTQGAVAFGAFLWALFTATAVLTFLSAFRGHSRTTKTTHANTMNV